MTKENWQLNIIRQLSKRPYHQPPFSGYVSKKDKRFVTSVRRLHQKRAIVILSEDDEGIRIQLAGVPS